MHHSVLQPMRTRASKPLQEGPIHFFSTVRILRHGKFTYVQFKIQVDDASADQCAGNATSPAVPKVMKTVDLITAWSAVRARIIPQALLNARKRRTPVHCKGGDSAVRRTSHSSTGTELPSEATELRGLHGCFMWLICLTACSSLFRLCLNGFCIR